MKRIIHNFYTVNKKRTNYPYLPFMFLWVVFILSGVKGYSEDCTVDAGENQNVCANDMLVLSGQTTGDLLDGGNIVWSQGKRTICNNC
jgi:hypothetical protein